MNPRNGHMGAYANGDLDGGASCLDGLATDEAFRPVHSNASNRVLSKMLGNFKHKSLARWGF